MLFLFWNVEEYPFHWGEHLLHLFTSCLKLYCALHKLHNIKYR